MFFSFSYLTDKVEVTVRKIKLKKHKKLCSNQEKSIKTLNLDQKEMNFGSLCF